MTSELTRLAPGESSRYRATASYSDGTTRDVSGEVTWRSEDPAVASVDSGGLVSGVAHGSTDIVASLSDARGSLAVAVDDPGSAGD